MQSTGQRHLYQAGGIGEQRECGDDSYDEETHCVSEISPFDQRVSLHVYRVNVMSILLKAGVAINKFCYVKEEHGNRYHVRSPDYEYAQRQL